MERAALRVLCAAGVLFLGACAHKAPHERIVAPVVVAQTAPPSETADSPPPSLALPREWQQQQGEDYDDLFDRMRAGFAFDEVQEPAIDQQLAWFEHNPD